MLSFVPNFEPIRFCVNCHLISVVTKIISLIQPNAIGILLHRVALVVSSSCDFCSFYSSAHAAFSIGMDFLSNRHTLVLCRWLCKSCHEMVIPMLNALSVCGTLFLIVLG